MKKKKNVGFELNKEEVLEMMSKAIAFDLLVEMLKKKKSK